jgi:hypothetical protein
MTRSILILPVDTFFFRRCFPELQRLPVELVRGRTLLVEDEAEAPLPSVCQESDSISLHALC